MFTICMRSLYSDGYIFFNQLLEKSWRKIPEEAVIYLDRLEASNYINQTFRYKKDNIKEVDMSEYFMETYIYEEFLNLNLVFIENNKIITKEQATNYKEIAEKLYMLNEKSNIGGTVEKSNKIDKDFIESTISF